MSIPSPANFLNLRLPISLALALFLAACASGPSVDLAAITEAEIANFSTPESFVYASGQPTQEQLAVLADSGIRHVISLRTPGEIDWDEAAVVASEGMIFHSIPVSGRDGVTPENALALETLLASLDGMPALVHCGSSNRVGALKAVSLLETNGASVEEALNEGRRWGLTGMEDRVRAILSGN